MKTKLLKKARKDTSICRHGKGSNAVYAIVYYESPGPIKCSKFSANELREALEFRRKKILERANYLAEYSFSYNVHRGYEVVQ